MLAIGHTSVGGGHTLQGRGRHAIGGGHASPPAYRDGPVGVYGLRDLPALGLAPLDFLWPCQDTAGNLAGAIGGVDLASNGAGVAVYQAAIASWIRKAIGSTADGDVRNWRAAGGSGPSPVAGNVAWLGTMLFPSLPGADRIVMHPAVTAPNLAVTLRTTGALRLTCNALTADGVYNYVDGAAHPIWVLYNKRLGTVELITDRERIVGTYNAGVTDSNKGVGQCAGAATGIYRCLELGAAVGLNADRDWKAVMQALRWNVVW